MDLIPQRAEGDRFQVYLPVSTVANNPMRFIELVSIGQIYALSPLSIIRLCASALCLCFATKSHYIDTNPLRQMGVFGFVKEFKPGLKGEETRV